MAIRQALESRCQWVCFALAPYLQLPSKRYNVDPRLINPFLILIGGVSSFSGWIQTTFGGKTLMGRVFSLHPGSSTRYGTALGNESETAQRPPPFFTQGYTQGEATNGSFLTKLRAHLGVTRARGQQDGFGLGCCNVSTRSRSKAHYLHQPFNQPTKQPASQPTKPLAMHCLDSILSTRGVQ